MGDSHTTVKIPRDAHAVLAELAKADRRTLCQEIAALVLAEAKRRQK